MNSKRKSTKYINANGGAHWISYSDMMASLLMVFVLAVFICVYRLNQQALILTERESEVESQRIIIIGQQASLDVMKLQLSDRERELSQKQEDVDSLVLILGEKQAELDALILTNTQQAQNLDSLQLQLDQQQAALADKEEQIAKLVGVRTDIIKQLSYSLSTASLSANVDGQTGDIVLESTVLFDTNRDEIKESGKELLSRFLPVYLNVLLSEEYDGYIGEIIIEGHTDTDGSYISNLQLSQNRARAVAQFCLEMPGLSDVQRRKLERVLNVTGRSEADPVYYPGTAIEDKEASRRVTFKFRLKDTEMVTEMQKILQDFNEN